MFTAETKLGLRQGNPDAYREVFRMLYPRLKGYCKLFVPNENEVEDIIQDSFLMLWEKRHALDSKKKIESLIFVMVRNRCLNYLKKQRLESGNVSIDMLNFSELQHLYQIDLHEKEEKTIEEMLVVSFQEAVNQLPEKTRDVFVQCKLEGKKQKDVADHLGISLKMVEKHIAKAKVIIGNQLKQQYPSMALIIFMLLE
jgi:RNA polymerase sigma-70 factor, ECF subfamily